MSFILIQVLVSALLAFIIGRLVFKQTEKRKYAEQQLSNIAFIFIIGIKLSLLLTNFHAVSNEILYLAYGWGSSINLAIGALASFFYAFYLLKKKGDFFKYRSLYISTVAFCFGLGMFTMNGLKSTFESNPVLIDRALFNEIQLANGGKLKLDNEKPLIINFWATWCPPCRAEMPELNTHYMNSGNNNFLTINHTKSEQKGAQSVTEFILDKGYALPIHLDKTGYFINMLNISSFPTTVVIDKNGVIIEKKVGVVSASFLSKYE